MSKLMESVTKIEDQVLEALESAQEPFVSATRKVAERVEPALPELTVSYVDRLPTFTEIVETQFAFAGKLLEQQKEFVLALLDAAKPVTEKVSGSDEAIVVKVQAA
ncbi:MAG: hypothetical protein MUF83_01065 [Acidimicrobiales bacterium]|jgi:hypothetical protein|nr:hypothetical protein [Acidimicrobiales bacterium]